MTVYFLQDVFTSPSPQSPESSALSKSLSCSDHTSSGGNPSGGRRVVFNLNEGAKDEESSSEEEVSAQKMAKRESVKSSSIHRRSKSISVFNVEDKDSDFEDVAPGNLRSKSLKTGLLREPSGELSEEDDGLKVEIHRDPTRIWLCSSIYDHDFVDYLSQHDKTRDSLVLVDSMGVKRSAENGKLPLQATSSVGQDDESDEEPTVAKPRPKFEYSRSRSKSTGSMRRSLSMTFTDTVAMATGHVVDNLGGFLEPSIRNNTKKGLGIVDEEKQNPLANLRRVAVPKNPFISPMYAPDEWLKKLPCVKLVVKTYF